MVRPALQKEIPGLPDFREDPFGLPVSIHAPPRHPCALAADHRHPVAAGGSNDPSNLQLVHWRVNQAKRDRWEGVRLGGRAGRRDGFRVA